MRVELWTCAQAIERRGNLTDPDPGKAARSNRGRPRPVPQNAAEESLAVAQYLGDMIGQLQAMASAAKLDLLVYLLAMARQEADAHARLPGKISNGQRPVR